MGGEGADGALVRDFARRGVTLDLVDAVIAATCMAHGLALATINVRRYPMAGIRFAPVAPLVPPMRPGPPGRPTG